MTQRKRARAALAEELGLVANTHMEVDSQPSAAPVLGGRGQVSLSFDLRRPCVHMMQIHTCGPTLIH